MLKKELFSGVELSGKCDDGELLKGISGDGGEDAEYGEKDGNGRTRQRKEVF